MGSGCKLQAVPRINILQMAISFPRGLAWYCYQPITPTLLIPSMCTEPTMAARPGKRLVYCPLVRSDVELCMLCSRSALGRAYTAIILSYSFIFHRDADPLIGLFLHLQDHSM